MIKILCIAPPLSGHLFPIVYAMKQLEKEFPNKYEIIFITGIDKKEYIESQDYQFHELFKSDPNLMRELVEMTNIFKQYQKMTQNYEMLTDELKNQIEKINPDITIIDFISYQATSAIRHLNRPWISHFATPFVIDTGDGVPIYLGGLKYKNNLAYRLRNKLALKIQRIVKKVIVRKEKKTFGKYYFKLYDKDGSETIYSKDGILALGTKELEFPKTWPKHMKFIGHGAISEDKDIVFSQNFELAQKRILVTTGTMSADNLEKTYQLIEQVAKEMPENYFIFTDGNAKKSNIQIQNNIERHAFIPYEPMLQKFDIVIHHGGAGIVHSCIRHENYQIVLPNMYDQFDYAARLEDKKIATWVKKRSVKNVVKAINEIEKTQSIEIKKEFSKYLNGYNSGEIINGLIDDILSEKHKSKY